MALTAKRRQHARLSIRAYKAAVVEAERTQTRASEGVPRDPFFFLPGGRDATDAARFLTAPFEEHANFFAVVSALAWSFIQAPLQIGRWGADGNFVPDESHPLDAFLRRPNGLCSGDIFWWLRLIHLATVGEAFLVLEGPGGTSRTDPKVVPVRGWLYPGGSRWTHTERVDADGLPMGWVHERPDGKQAYLRNELVYWRYPLPGNPLRGLPPAKPATALLLADAYADRYQVSTLKNDAKPGGVLVNKQVPALTDDQFAQVSEGWEDRQGGPDNVKRTAIMTGGWEYQPLAFSPADIEYLNQRRYSREQLCGVFRVPKWMLSSTDDINRSISAEMRASFFEDVIASQHKMAAADLEAQLLHGIDPTLTARFLLDDIPAMREARRARWAAAKAVQDAGATLREANRQFDLGIQKIDALPGVDTVYKPAGMQVVQPDGTLLNPMLGAGAGLGGFGPFGLTPLGVPAPGLTPDVPAPSGDNIVATEALNGAQVNAIVTVAKEVAAGVLPLSSALAIATIAFPITDAQAKKIFGDIEVGTLAPGTTDTAAWRAAMARMIRAATARPPTIPPEPLVVPVGFAAQCARTPAERARLLGYENSDAWRRLDWRAKLTWVQRRSQWLRWTAGVREPANEMMAKPVHAWLVDLADEILMRFDRLAGDRSRRNGHARAEGEGPTFPEGKVGDVFPDIQAWTKRLVTPLRETAVEIAKLASAYTSGELGPGTTLDLQGPGVQSFIEARMNLLSNYRGNIPFDIRKQIGAALQKGIAEGKTIQELREVVRSFGEAMKDPARTLRIASTEAGSLANGLRYAVAEVGADTHEWITSGGPTVRAAHQADEDFSTANPVKIGQRFPNTGLLYPQETGGPPEQTIECHCVSVLNPRTP